MSRKQHGVTCTQGISMLVWGFAKLGIVPGADLIRVSRHHFTNNLSAYQHQAIANMFYSLARLKQCPASLCSKVQQQVMERLNEFSPQVRGPLRGTVVLQLPSAPISWCRCPWSGKS